MAATAAQRWKVGDVVVTSVVEEQTDHVPPQFFFPEATPEAVARHGWLVPDFADASGAISLRIQALVVEVGGRRVLVDPCVGNGKTSNLPFWNDQQWPFLDNLAAAGFDVGGIDEVVHTHLHADHVGWDTHRDGDAWVPTFTSARHLYTEAALEFVRDPGGYDNANVLRESVQPILDAGLADIVAEDADLGDGLRLEPTGGHTPGHVSLWIESAGEVALVSGDFVHHPVQCAEPGWSEIGDSDADEARATRRRMLTRAAERDVLFIGTHFPTRPAGRITADGQAWRFTPEA
ncbi:MAG: MBL fold metallo-hydrolase [Acidimicrobiia bacterium]|nr:MBL fold metallo-hydrolase [Acidimicrobiia bacterium]